MQRGRGGWDGFSGGFGDPFAGFAGFEGRPGSLTSSMFGGRDPFDDPFFTQPFGSIMGPGIFGRSMFGSRGSLFGEDSSAGFLEQRFPLPPSRSQGPIIREISSDGEEENEMDDGEKKENRRKHFKSGKEPYVQDPDEEEESKIVKHRSDRAGTMRPKAQTYSFQSSTVRYGGVNGAYYTASTTRKMGGDGVVMEESKEADSTTGRATHRISRGIHDMGHTVTRKLNVDGRVDSLQTLHNLNEDELTGFNEAWKGEARQHLPGWNAHDVLDNGKASGGRGGGRHGEEHRRGGGWALPSTGQPRTSAARGNPQSRPKSFNGRAR